MFIFVFKPPYARPDDEGWTGNLFILIFLMHAFRQKMNPSG